jgi:hypothetical protein
MIVLEKLEVFVLLTRFSLGLLALVAISGDLKPMVFNLT